MMESENAPYVMLNAKLIKEQLAEQVPDCEGIDGEVIRKISVQAENHLRRLLSRLSDIAGHRLESLRVDPMYQQVNDPRKHLKFMDEFEKQAQIRQESMEKEIYLQPAKLRSKSKDVALKAREIRDADQEEKRSREANQAAITALGGSFALKTMWGPQGPTKGTLTSGMAGTQMFRPRIRRVIMRDLQCALNLKHIPNNSPIVSYLAYGLIQSDAPQ